MKPHLLRPAQSAEFPTPEGCRILESWNAAEDTALSIARARVAPGITTRNHRLKGVVERYVILEGRGRVVVGDAIREEVGPGDVVIIPEGVTQRIANIGEGDLVFYCICTPRFTPECYESLE